MTERADRDGRDLFRPRRFPEVKPADLRRKLDAAMGKEVLAVQRFVNELCHQYEAAYDAFHYRVVGDEAKVRSTSPADPTGSVVAANHRARRELEKAAHFAVQSFARHQNELDARARNLERAMAQLKPGPSARNPRFERPVRGDAMLPKADREELAEAQERRRGRGEAYGG